MAKGSSVYAAKSGLLFHRNLISSLSDFSDKLSNEFMQKYGIPVKFYFDTRNMGEIKIKFRAGVKKTKMKASGIMDVKGTLKAFILNNMPSISSFLVKAINESSGKPLLSSVSITDGDGKTITTSWIGTTKSGDGGLSLK